MTAERLRDIEAELWALGSYGGETYLRARRDLLAWAEALDGDHVHG